MRLFISIELPKEIRDYLEELKSTLRRLPAKIKWVAKKNLHITLKFLGEVEDKKIEILKKRLENIKTNPFEIELSRIGFFPSSNYIRVIWVGVIPEENVIRLQRMIDGELIDMFPGEQRFEAHITIGRVKFIKDREKFVKELSDVRIKNIKFRVNNFKLMKSTLRREGPIYEEIASFELKNFHQ